MTKKIIWSDPISVPFIEIEGKGRDDDETGRLVKPSIVNFGSSHLFWCSLS